MDGDIEMMKDFLKTNNVNINEIKMTSHHESKYSSFKINISVNDRDKVLDPRFWPFGVKCEMWRAPRPRENDNNYHPFNNYSDSENDDDNESNSGVTNNF